MPLVGGFLSERASEIWFVKRGGFWWVGPYKKGHLKSDLIRGEAYGGMRLIKRGI
jgi:hypothetical protein